MVNLKKSIDRVTEQGLAAQGITDKNVLRAIMGFPREKFVEESFRELSYSGSPLPIGFNQTISSIYIVALMTQALSLNKNHKVLEIGTGSGYQSAILSGLCMRKIKEKRKKKN